MMQGKSIVSFIILALMLLLSTQSYADEHAAATATYSSAPLEASLIVSHQQIRAGDVLDVALISTPAKGWHTYWKNPGDAGLPIQVSWMLPEGVTPQAMQWPMPRRLTESGDVAVYGYSDRVVLRSSLRVPKNYQGDTFPVMARVQWLVCHDICIPESATLRTDVAVGQHAVVAPAFATAAAGLFPQPHPASVKAMYTVENGHIIVRLEAGVSMLQESPRSYFYPVTPLVVHNGGDQARVVENGITYLRQPLASRAAAQDEAFSFVWRTAQGQYVEGTAHPADFISPVFPSSNAGGVSFVMAVVLAFAGGMILNLMPCVFPILSLKILSYVSKAGKEKRHLRQEGWVYAAGVVLSFVLMALVLVALRTGGESIGWGFQLQSPVFVAYLAYGLLALGLSLSGFLTLGTRLMGVGVRWSHQQGHRGAFFTGVLATVLATPCTAPFMGSAIGYALAQPVVMTVPVFISLGLGMATPYVVLTYVPALLARLPRPGAWMETFKKIMALPLYATVAWLLWVLARQTDAAQLMRVMAGAIGLVALVLILPRLGQRRVLRQGVLCAGLAVLLILPLLAMPVSTPVTPSAIEPFSASRLEALRQQDTPVFVNVTAAWCITCLANERLALSRVPVQDFFAQQGIITLTADWTRRDPDITAFLQQHGRQGVPLYVFYPAGKGAPVVLPQILTPRLVIDAISATLEPSTRR